MPRYQPSDDELDDSYGRGPMGPPADRGDGGEESVDREEAMAKTAIISNQILSPEGEPLKAGDEIVVRVVKNYGDESEIEYAPKSGAADEGGDETALTPGNEEAELTALSNEGY